MRGLFIIPLFLFPFGLYACGSAPPIAIQWKNVPTRAGSNSRGVPLNAGRNQEQGLRISTLFSNTWIHSSIVCEGNGNKTQQRACEGQAGSTLDISTPEFNTSFQVPFNFSRDPNDAFITAQLGEYLETGHIQTLLNTATGSLPLGDYPMSIMTLVLSNIQRKSGIGLGRWSTFLDQLYQLGHIPSKAWGFSQGSYSSANPSDGELVLGGKNLAAIGGEMRNFTLTNTRDNKTQGLHCLTQVLVSDFVVSIQGTPYSLLPDKNFRIFACIDPFQQSISMPEVMMGKLLDLTGAIIAPPDGAESPKPAMNATSNRRIENVSITIQDDIGSFTVAIPGNETMNPIYGKLPDGKNGFIEGDLMQLEFRNRSDNYPVKDAYEELPSLILGGIFLSQQYLFVDYSRNIFNLAPAAPRGGDKVGRDLRKVCDFDDLNINPTGIDGVKIGLSVLSGIAWLLVMILACLVIYLYRKGASGHRDNSGTGKRVSDAFRNSGPMKAIERQFSQYSEVQTLPTTIVTTEPVRARTNSNTYTETE